MFGHEHVMHYAWGKKRPGVFKNIDALFYQSILHRQSNFYPLNVDDEIFVRWGDCNIPYFLKIGYEKKKEEK